MSLKDKRSESTFGKKVESPVEIHLNWNPTNGVWRYSILKCDDYPEGEKGDMTNIRGVILEPRLYKVTGQGEDARVFSNLCMSFRQDLLTVWRKPFSGGKAKKINEKPAPWREIEKAVKAEEGRYTKIVAVHLIYAETAVYDAKKGTTGKVEKRKLDFICFLQMSGNAISKGWGDSLENAEINEFASFGMAFTQKDTVETKGRKARDIYMQPVFEFVDLTADKDKAPILDAADEKSLILDAYLDEYFGGEPDHLAFKEMKESEEDEEEEDEKKYEKASVKSGTAVTKPKPGQRKKRDDDDFPF